MTRYLPEITKNLAETAVNKIRDFPQDDGRKGISAIRQFQRSVLARRELSSVFITSCYSGIGDDFISVILKAL